MEKKIGHIEGFSPSIRRYGIGERLHSCWKQRLNEIDRLMGEGFTHVAIGEGKPKPIKTVWKETYWRV